MEITIGTNPEFMVKYRGNCVYPSLSEENYAMRNNSDLTDKLDTIPRGDFGHCAEIRPLPATSGKQLVLNTIDVMSTLPQEFKYHTKNTHMLSKEMMSMLLHIAGSKKIPQAQNIYKKPILKDCPLYLVARKEGLRLLFCGCHMHISTTRTIRIKVGKEVVEHKENIDLPAESLVWLFDNLLFSCFIREHGFNAGSHRSMGYYERKSHGGFEYRSLGSSAFTPKRLRLIADLMIDITEQFMSRIDKSLAELRNAHPETYNPTDFLSKDGKSMLKELKKTKPITSPKGILKTWVPFI